MAQKGNAASGRVFVKHWQRAVKFSPRFCRRPRTVLDASMLSTKGNLFLLMASLARMPSEKGNLFENDVWLRKQDLSIGALPPLTSAYRLSSCVGVQGKPQLRIWENHMYHKDSRLWDSFFRFHFVCFIANCCVCPIRATGLNACHIEHGSSLLLGPCNLSKC